MKALQYTGPEQLEFIDIPTPKIADDEVLLKIKKVGICGTDLHIYKGGMSDLPVPLIMGHEFVGDVVEVGKSVVNVKVGDKASAEHVVGCGVCKYCAVGRRNICVKPVVLGLHKAGALAEYMAIPANLVYALPESMSYDEGVLVEPLSIAVYAIRLADVTVGDTVGVIGQGPIGLFLDQVAQAAGATVFGVDVMDGRLNYAKEHHLADMVINSKTENAVAVFQANSRTDGADVVFEAVGIEPTAKLAIDMTRRGGTVVLVGVFEKETCLDMMKIVKRELIVKGSWTCVNVFEPTINMMHTGKVKTEGLITHRYSFDKAIDAFKDSLSYSENRIKSVIEF
jgi:2-desacetyl-2-hydroxyethyl bacteriochlorophyllide A dehydrogenase